MTFNTTNVYDNFMLAVLHSGNIAHHMNDVTLNLHLAQLVLGDVFRRVYHFGM